MFDVQYSNLIEKVVGVSIDEINGKKTKIIDISKGRSKRIESGSMNEIYHLVTNL